jgi:hypothetical protein
VTVRVWVVGLAIATGAVVCDEAVWGRQNAGQAEHVTTVHGRVLNKVTKEPIGRALVTTVGDEYAVMTDDRGQFEMKIAERVDRGQGAGFAGSLPVAGSGGMVAISRLGTAGAFQAKKPGFLENRYPAIGRSEEKSTELEATIYLQPEALIVGRVTVPGSEGDVRIRCELYRHQTVEGRERWQSAGNFTTWGSGEFRFSGLEAGTYRLITHEEIDRDSLVGPGAPMFGYPPVYYPNTTDFSMATPIVVKAGETAQVNLTVTRRQYYPVRIPVRNAPLAGANLTVHPMGHWGPGWSLDYNQMQRMVEGMLPDGNYTVELETYGEATSTGVGNFVVNGAALEGTPLYLTPDASVTLNVRTEFQTARNGASQESAETLNRERLGNLAVMLRPLEEFGSTGRDVSAVPVEGTENRTLTIANVRPGRYRLVVQTTNGYAASVQSGEVDLLKQPLVVGIGGGAPPVEITLRDDGAEVSGTVEGVAGVRGDWQLAGMNIQQYWRVFLVPTRRGMSQEPPWYRTWDGKFAVSNVPPGEYLVVAYEEGQRDLNLPFGDEEFVKSLEEKGQRIHVDAGDKVANVRVKVLAGNDGE